MGNSAKRDGRKIDKAERRRKALELRKAGATYEQIGQQLGCNRGNAHKDVTEAIQDIYREPAEAVLQLEIGRLDVMLLGVWSKAKAGDCQAIDRVLRIQERRAAYLGLDAPKRTEVSGALDVTQSDTPHDELLGRLALVAARLGAGADHPKPDGSGGA